MSDKCCKTTEACTDEPTQIYYTSEVFYDGDNLECVSDPTFSAVAGDKSTSLFSKIWSKLCSLGATVSAITTDYISNVVLNGTSLDFTGVGNAFNGSVDLSNFINEVVWYKMYRAGDALSVASTYQPFNSSTEYTVAAAGTYEVYAEIEVTLDSATAGAELNAGIAVMKNGSLASSQGAATSSRALIVEGAKISMIVPIMDTNISCIVGDVLDIEWQGDDISNITSPYIMMKVTKIG